MPLALFDLDHTLLDGDTDVLWCEFLLAEGVLEAGFAARNRAMEAQYQAGTVSAADFCTFYVSTLAGRTPEEWLPLRERFLQQVVAPRLTPQALALVQQHRDAGDTLVMTTATNRLLTEATALRLGIGHLLATECEVGADGRLTGRPAGVLNMREGKLVRMRQWLATQGLDAAALTTACFYSDSVNDLPLLLAVGRPVAVDPDARLQAHARAAGWPVVSLRDRSA